MIYRIFGAAIVLMAAVSTAAFALTISDDAKKAEALAASGKYVEAIDALDDAADMVWEKSPLVCRRVLWVAERAPRFGEYNPRESDVFKSGEDMLAYAEPMGFGWRKSGEIWRPDLTADFIVRDKAGKQLFRKDDFGKFTGGSRARNRAFDVNLTYSVKAPPGEYIAETHFRDKATGKDGSCSLPFQIE